MHFLLVLLLLVFPTVVSAQGLTLARNMFMGSVVIDDKKVPVDIGATVALAGEDENGIPKSLDIEALVLGVEDGVVFLELEKSDAVRLARAQAAGAVTLRQVATPNVEMMAQRIDARRSGAVVYVAPRFRRFTVTAGLADDVDGFRAGRRVVVTQEGSNQSVHGSPVYFLEAKENEAERFDVTLVAWEGAVLSIYQAEAEGALSIVHATVLAADPEIECSIRTRSGGRVVTVPIPCSD